MPQNFPSAARPFRFRFRFLSAAVALAALLALAGGAAAWAQSAPVHFNGPFSVDSATGVTYGEGVVADAAGNLYLTGPVNLTFLAVNGDGSFGAKYLIDGAGSSADGLAIDSANNLYRSNSTGSVIKYTYTGLNASAQPTFTKAAIGSGWSYPAAVTVDASFNVYVLDAANNAIVELTPNGAGGYTQTTLYTNALLSHTTGLSRDSSGDFYFTSGPNTNAYNQTGIESSTIAVYKLTPSGGGYALTTLGTGWSSPSSTAVDAAGDVWVADYSAAEIYELTPGVGGYAQSPYAPIVDLRALTVSKLGLIYGVTADPAAIWYGGTAPHSLGTQTVKTAGSPVAVTVYFSAAEASASYAVVTEGAVIGDFTDAGGGTCTQATSYAAGGSCTVNVLFTPTAAGLRRGALVIRTSHGTVLATNYLYGVGLAPVAGLTPGQMGTVAGTGTPCLANGAACGDGGAATSAMLNNPTGVVADAQAGFYIGDTGSHLVRHLLAGVIGSIAGNGAACADPAGACGDGGPATSASLTPSAVALDGAGNLYIVDVAENRIRMVNLATGIISTVAGSGAVCASPTAACGDGGAAMNAQLNLLAPGGLAVDGMGNLIIADSGDNRIRSVDPSTGLITTLAGSGAVCTASAVCGDGGQALLATFNAPAGLAVDAAGDLMIADAGDNRIREISSLTGAIATVAGTGGTCAGGACGDGGSATAATLANPTGVGVDAAGDVYIADTGDNAIRWVRAANQQIATLAGNSAACSPSTAACGDGGSATSASLTQPAALALDNAGDLEIADSGTNRLRQVNVSASAAAFAATVIGTQSADSPRSVTLNNLGNAALSVTVPPSGSNPSFPAGFQRDASSTCPTVAAAGTAGSLAAAASCTVAIDFDPAAVVAYSDSVSLTDTSTGAAGAIQTIAVSGAGTPVPLAQTITFTLASPVTYGVAPITLAATASSGLPVTFTVSGPASLSGNVLTVIGAGTVTVTANQAGNSTYAAAPALPRTLSVSKAAVTLAASAPGAVAGATDTITGTVAFAGASLPTGAVTVQASGGSAVAAICTGSTTPLSCTALLPTSGLAKGLHTLTFAIAADSNYNPGAVSASFAVRSGGATVSLAVTPATPQAGTGPETLAATVSDGGSPVTAGTVSFCVAATKCQGANLLGTAQLTSSGIASTAVRLLAGSYNLIAVLGATNTEAAATSAAVAYVVTPPSLATTTTLTSSGSGPYTLTGTVAGGGAATLAGGTVTFTNANGVVLATRTLAGTPAYAPATSLLTGSAGMPIFGDFDGDGIPDMVQPTSTGLTFWHGNGDGTFAQGASAALASTHLIALGVARDFNNDGKLDLVAVTNNHANPTTTTDYAMFFAGDGDGTFQSPSAVNIGYVGIYSSNPVDIEAADFNGDGSLDLAIVERSGNGVAILLNNGFGGFTQKSLPAAGNASGAAIADFNGDGKLDLVISTDTNPGNFTVYLGNGDGTFTELNSIATTISSAKQVLAADFNGDGKPDFALVQYGTGVSIFLGKGDGTFTTGPVLPTACCDLNLALGDYNGDGNTDIIASTAYSTVLDLFAGNGAGGFASAQAVAVPTSGGYLSAVDVDGDGRADVAEEVMGGIEFIQQRSQLAASASALVVPGGPGQAIIATYSGDATRLASASPVLLLNGTPIATTLALSANPASGTVSAGGTTTLTAAVNAANLYGFSFAGTVNFKLAGVSIAGCSAVALVAGQATCTSAPLSAGSQSFQAVYSQDPNFAASTSNTVSFVTTPPSVSSVSPASGAPGGGTAVAITGTNFTGVTAVSFGGVAASGVVVNSPTSISAIAPAGSANAVVNVTVTSPAGTSAISAADQFTYTQASQTITFGALASVTYGTAPVVLGATASSGLAVVYTVSGPATLSGNVLTVTGGGAVTITASQAGNVNYLAAAPVPQILTVNPAALSLTASSGIMIYGGVPPTITASYLGFVNGDGPASLGTVACSTVATNTSHPGSYASTCAGATNANYTITVVNGAVTVSQATPQLAWANGAITYGQALSVAARPTSNVGGHFTYTANGSPVTGGEIEPAGSYAQIATFTPTDATDYTGGTVNNTLTVAPAAVTVTASSATMTYGGAIPTITASASGLVNGDALTSLVGLTCTTQATSGSNAGSYASSCTGAADANYTITYAPGTVTVGAANLVVTASSATMTYGGTAPTITPSFGGFVNGNSAASLTTQPVCSTLATSASNAGSYASSCAGAADANYSITYAPGTVTVGAANLVVTASSGTMTYGGIAPTIAASFNGFVNGNSAASLTTQPVCSTLATSASNAGSYASSCAGAADANYSITYAPGTVTVGAANLVVTASSGTMTYGGNVPTITASFNGFVNGNSAASLTAQPVCSTLANSTSNAGGYASSCAGAADANYSITYAPGTVTVGAANLVVTASSGTMTYGGTAPTIAASFNGFVNGNSAASLTTQPVCTTSATSSSNAGSYASSCAGAADANYSITYAPGTVTVGAANLVVTASSATMTYGGTAPTITASFNGFVNGNTAASLTTQPVCSTLATSASNAGSYPSSCTGAADANYTITYAPGTVTVGAANLVVTASSATMTYGGTAPTITASYNGFVNGNTAASLTAQPVCSTLATSSSNAGTYASSCAGAADANYTITYAPGTVTAGAANLVITASSGTMTYGGTAPTITPSAAGLTNGDSLASLAGLTCSTLATSASPAGTYASSCVGATDANYTISYVPGTVTAGAANLVITASSGTMTYGGIAPTITPIAAGLTNGDSLASLAGLSCSTVATSASPAGSYASSCVGAADANYTITYLPGTVTVGAANLVVTASSGTMTYGGIAPTITPSAAGLTNGDSLASLAGLSCSAVATSASPAGTYASSCVGAADANYTITYASGTVTVGAANLIITASSGTMTFGGTPPTITPTAVGLTNGDSLASLAGLSCSTLATSASPAGSYASSCVGATDANYTISYVPGTVTAGAANLVITASSGTMTYGGTVPAITAGFSGFVNGNNSASLTAQPVCSTVATSASNAGIYASSCAGAVDANYIIQYASGTVTVGAAGQAVSFTPLANAVYTGAPILVPLSAAATSGLPVTFTGSGSTYSVSGSTLTITGAGPVTVTATAAASGDYLPASASQSIAVSLPNWFNYALFATNSGCAAININGNGNVDSYDSASGAYPAGQQSAGANIGSNGNVRLSGSTAVYGTLFDPNGTTVGPCPPAVKNSLTLSGRATVSGNITTLAAPVAFPDPPAPTPAPPTARQMINAGPVGQLCLSGNGNSGTTVAGCTVVGTNHIALAPGAYGNLSLGGGITTDLSAGTYRINSLVLGGNSNLNVVSGPVVIALDGAYQSTVLDITGGALVNNTVPANVQIIYAGSGQINLNGGPQASGVIYAPDAQVVLSGNADWYGAIIATTIQITGNASVHYDRELAGAYPAWLQSASGPQAQRIAFDALPQTALLGVNSTLVLNANSTSGLPVSYAVSGPATLNGNTLSITGAGAVAVTASQAGSDSYLAATPLTQTVNGVVPGGGPSSVTLKFNGAPGNSTVWFSAIVDAANVQDGTTIAYTSGAITFSAYGKAYTVAVPNATVTFSAAAVCATTTFNSSTNTWQTIAPLTGECDHDGDKGDNDWDGRVWSGGEVFLTAAAFPVPAAGFPRGGVTTATWSGTILTDPGVKVSWKGMANVFGSFSTSYTDLGVKGGKFLECVYPGNADEAGSPENFMRVRLPNWGSGSGNFTQNDWGPNATFTVGGGQ